MNALLPVGILALIAFAMKGKDEKKGPETPPQPVEPPPQPVKPPPQPVKPPPQPVKPPPAPPKEPEPSTMGACVYQVKSGQGKIDSFQITYLDALDLEKQDHQMIVTVTSQPWVYPKPWVITRACDSGPMAGVKQIASEAKYEGNTAEGWIE